MHRGADVDRPVGPRADRGQRPPRVKSPLRPSLLSNRLCDNSRFWEGATARPLTPTSGTRPDAPLQFDAVNLFQRGMVPLVGFKSTSVCYECHERMAGQPHYPFSKMVALAGDGITSLSVKPTAHRLGGGDGRVAREPRGQCMAACC